MIIMKASAGSGKTYNLSKTYLNLLLGSKEQHPHRHILAVTFTNKATAEMKARILRDLAKQGEEDPKAQKLLIDILHDYSAFSVSTIDKFFQRALKAFSREIGQFADYQIELDRKSLICECMDRILDSLTEDNKVLLNWIKDYLSGRLALGEKAAIDDGLYEMGEKLKNEEHRELAESLQLNDAQMFSRERLEILRRECTDYIKSFEHRIAVLSCGTKKAKPGKPLEFDNTVRLYKNHPEVENLVNAEFDAYNTAHTILKMLYSLGLAGEFYREFDIMLKEKNVMCLDESNTILRDIINGSDAPFVYEKLGVRYDHFLLDEFQDTSNIQWSNFLPLLRESESRGGKNLIVGDVKQSIYRFRDSDWNLLATKVGQEFPSAQTTVLGENWRSCDTIVQFNNRFFEFAASELGLKVLYADVVQKPQLRSKLENEGKEAQPGYVRVSFCSNQLQATLDSVNAALNAGARPCDVAVLVRGRAEGAEIAEYLISNKKSVLSDDSLELRSSLTVQRLVSLLSSFENPKDTVTSFLASSMNLTMPTTYHSLVDLCEAMLRSLREYDEASFAGETLFVQSFMDELQSWTEHYGNDLSAFLKYWDKTKKYIGSPQSADSVRVLTIHKSKGLEFPYVIFPYSNKVNCYHPDVHWCSMSSNAFLPESSKGIYPVSLSSSSSKSYFANAFNQEQRKQLVDNINIFYVALTRAVNSLHIIAEDIEGSYDEILEYQDFSQILYCHVKGEKEWHIGKPYDFRKDVVDDSDKLVVQPFEAAYHSIPLGTRLQASTDASDFFSEEGAVSISSSARMSGIALHDILSRVFASGDVKREVAASLRAGAIDAELAYKAEQILQERVEAHPEWFPAVSNAVAVLNEQSIIDAQGLEHRPDRVIIRGLSDKELCAEPPTTGASVLGGLDRAETQVLVIDFKFGSRRAIYLSQVANYCELYRQMGYPNVSGIVWYVADDRWEQV